MASTALAVNGVDFNRLTDRQKRFVGEYLITLNSKDAAIRAGYAKKSAAAKGCQLLTHPLVSRVIGKAMRLHAEHHQLEREQVLQELHFLCTRDVIDLTDADGKIVVDDLRALPERIRKCIDSLKVKTDILGNQTVELKLSPKNPAVELAMRHFGMLVDKHEIDIRPTLDWDELARAAEASPNPLHERLRALEDASESFVKANGQVGSNGGNERHLDNGDDDN